MIFFVLLLLVPLLDAYKILIFSPAISKSHVISNNRIADELAAGGHDVVVLEPDYLNFKNSVKGPKLAKRWHIEMKNYEVFLNVWQAVSNGALDEPSLFNAFTGMYEYQHAHSLLCRGKAFSKVLGGPASDGPGDRWITNEPANGFDYLLQMTDVFEKVKAYNFDAIFTEQIALCGIGYGHAVGIKRTFYLSSCPFMSNDYEELGLPIPTSTIPVSWDISNEFKFVDRLYNFLANVGYTLVFKKVNGELTQHFRDQFGSNFPEVNDLTKEVDMIFLATDELIDHSGPTAHNIVHIGGVGVHEGTHVMDEKFKAEMEKGSKGVVLFSLGTIANTTRLPSKIMENIIEIAKRLPDYHFLIRADTYDKNTFAYGKGVENVLVSDWLPQPAILEHPRLSLFITHAGYNSLVEASRAGVAIVTIPFLFDQDRNSRAVEIGGWGVRRTKHQFLTEPETIEVAIREALENDRYREGARRLKKLIFSKPQSATDRLLSTTKWVLDNEGIPELKFHGRYLNSIVYFNVDVILFLVSLVVVVIVVSFLITRKVISTLKVQKKSKKQ